MAKRDRDETKKGMADLFASSGTDLVGNIIAGDRQRSGRGAAAADENNYDNMTNNNVIKEYDKQTNKQADKQTSRQTDKQPHKQTTTQADREAHKQTNKLRPPAPTSHLPDSSSVRLAERVAQAAQMAETPTMTVTLRIPQALNDWLDGYVHQAWPERIKKQELVVEALRLLIARRGNPKEEIIETDLFPR